MKKYVITTKINDKVIDEISVSTLFWLYIAINDLPFTIYTDITVDRRFGKTKYRRFARLNSLDYKYKILFNRVSNCFELKKNLKYGKY